MRRQHK